MPAPMGRRDPQPRKQVQKPKKAPLPKKASSTASNPHSSAIPSEIIALFQRTFALIFSNPSLTEILQTVKGLLYNRDYPSAFGSPQHLEAYVVRWSPSRALCYSSVFLDLCPELRAVFTPNPDTNAISEVVCIGGGAGAELVAVATAVKQVGGKAKVTAIDVAEWGEVKSMLVATINECYGVGAEQFDAEFHRADILDEESQKLVPRASRLVTICFTTNELYAQNKAMTTRFLTGLAACVEKGCLLLVLESAGSYSTVEVGGKTFRMEILLEHTLLGRGDLGEWEKVYAEESRWYRLPEGLKYPLALENMRYSVRVFRRK